MRGYFFIVICSLFFLQDLGAVPPSERGEIKIIVSGLSSDEGIIKIGLYNNRESYESRGSIASFVSLMVEPKDKEAVCMFSQIPYGEYTIKLFHDKNHNGVVDKNVFGIPNENFGFSNNPKVFLGLPSYS